MRRKGQEKRERLVQAVLELLTQKPLSELRSADIAKTAGTSAPNFYLYFDSVDDAVLAAAESVSLVTPEVLALVQADWPADDAWAHAHRFVVAFAAHWQANAAVLRACSLRVAEGDPRFKVREEQAVMPLLQALAGKLAASSLRGDEAGQVHAPSTAGPLVAMLDRLCGYMPMGRSKLGVTDERLLESAATVIATIVCGPLQMPPQGRRAVAPRTKAAR